MPVLEAKILYTGKNIYITYARHVWSVRAPRVRPSAASYRINWSIAPSSLYPHGHPDYEIEISKPNYAFKSPQGSVCTVPKNEARGTPYD